jgi:hypothetical protein
VLVSQGLLHPTQGFDLSTGDATRLRSGSYAGADLDGVQGYAGDASDADDLIRDPEEQQQQQGPGKGATAAAAAAAAAGVQIVQQRSMSADVKPESDGQQQQQMLLLNSLSSVPVKQEQGLVEQQQAKQAAVHSDGPHSRGSDVSEPSAATAHAAEPEFVAA